MGLSSHDFVRGSKKGTSSESSKQRRPESEEKVEKRLEMEAKIRGLEQQKENAKHNIRTMDTFIADYQRAANELDTQFLAITKDIEIAQRQHQKAKGFLERTSKQETKLSKATDKTAVLSTQMEDLHLEVKRQHLSLKQLAKEWQYKQDQQDNLNQVRTENRKQLEKYRKQKQSYASQMLDLSLKIKRLEAELKRLS